MKNTSIGLSQNVAGALAYFLGPVGGIFLLLVEKENRFVRFHAMQSTILFGACFVVSFVLSYIPVINIFWALLAIPLELLLFVVWLYLMYQAYQGKEYKLPVVGELSEKQLGKI